MSEDVDPEVLESYARILEKPRKFPVQRGLVVVMEEVPASEPCVAGAKALRVVAQLRRDERGSK